MAEKLSKKRKHLKKRKPKFRRLEVNNTKKISKSWRKPRGNHNKMRKRLRGKPKTVSIGYKSPESIRGVERNGMKKVRVFNPGDLEKLDKKTQEALIASGVGRKKRLEIMKTAEKLNVTVAN